MTFHFRVFPWAARLASSALLAWLGAVGLGAEQQVIVPQLVHLRAGEEREWSEFPAQASGSRLEQSFQAEANPDQAWSLSLRQQDVKQDWRVAVNGREIGRLHQDENDMSVVFAVPPGTLRDGANRLTIETPGARQEDDIRVGEVSLAPRTPQSLLRESMLSVSVRDDSSGGPLPCRITLLNSRGSLQQTGAESNERLAVRPGTVYTGDGRAEIPVPPGTYTVFAGRGFEYSLARQPVTVGAAATQPVSLALRREVATPGYVACDTHVHSRTHSGHGDATVQERMITLAAEGIELPIATDHNVNVDHRPFAEQMNVGRHFTPVIGNEVTTRLGHFNVFPIRAGAPPPDYRLGDWAGLFDAIDRCPDVKVVVLNHGRDLHSGFRPLGPAAFNDVTAQNLGGWQLRANAMEVVNSSATQTDIMRLFHDWMALLNRGQRITPVGSSDSHDVARHFVGQGRTYVRCDDRDVGALDVEAAVNSLVQGRVLVSYGLLARLEVDGRWSSGELARVAGRRAQVRVEVLGPHWTRASRVLLLANGRVIRDVEIGERAAGLPAGLIWERQWEVELPEHDVFLTAVALGPGIDEPYWRTAKPYQRRSPDWTPHVAGCSGAVWLDADGDGRATAARDYARRVLAVSQGDLEQLIRLLDRYDSKVAAHAANLLQESGASLLDERARQLIAEAPPAVRTGFGEYLSAWRRGVRARAENPR